MSSYVSAEFEKDYLPTSELVRIVLKSKDMGNVPPSPSAVYYPTDPDSLCDFVVAEYVSDFVGERFVRVATIADIATITPLRLNEFEDPTVDFIVAGTLPGDHLRITVPDEERWKSLEYPSGNVFVFSVLAVVNATTIRVTRAMPAFATGLSWALTTSTVTLTGLTGTTRRTGSPAGPVTFLDKRFNNYFTRAANAASFVESVKAQLDSLATDNTVANLVLEQYTGMSSV